MAFIVNLMQHFKATIPTPLKVYPLRASNIPIVAPTPVRPPPPPALGDPFSGLPPRPPITPPGPPCVLSPLGLTPGFLCDAERLYTPPPPKMVSLSVQDRTRWPDPIEAEQTILSLINPASPGTPYTKLVSSLGHCFLCGRVMALHIILNHYCLPLAEEHTSSARQGDRIFGKDLPFGIGLPTVPASTGVAGSSAPGTAPMGVAPVPVTPVNYEDGNTSSGTSVRNTFLTSDHLLAFLGSINRSRKRVLIPAGHEKFDKWMDKYYDQLEGLKPGLALTIAAGMPRNVKGPLLVDSNNKLYISSPRPLKRKYPDPDQHSELEGGEGGNADLSVEDSEDDDSPSKKRKRRKGDGEGDGDGKDDSECTGKGKGDGKGEDEGCGGIVDTGEVDIVVGSGEGPVKEEDVGDVLCPLGREGSFTTKDGKTVTLIDLTDD
ncbi:hypothetical protein V8D89_007587 [Ganoderma adspersum]